MIRRFFANRIPLPGETTTVFSVSAFVVFSWSILNLLYRLPAFILYYSVPDILYVGVYMLAFALLETFALMALLILMAALLPRQLFRDGFSYKASLLVIILTVISIHLQTVMNNQPRVSMLLTEALVGLMAWVLFVVLINKSNIIRKIVIDILDRLKVFLFIYIPSGIISLLVIFFRLLF